MVKYSKLNFIFRNINQLVSLSTVTVDKFVDKLHLKLLRYHLIRIFIK